MNRKDPGQSISGGFFVLGLERSKLQAEDFHHLARSDNIPWDASAEKFKSALKNLTNTQIYEVRRCDESGDVHGGMGAFEGWSFGCPYINQVLYTACFFLFVYITLILYILEFTTFHYITHNTFSFCIK